MTSPNLDEIVTTTLYNRSKKLADNVSKNNALLFRLQKRGKIKPVSGGRQIVQELSYAENGTFGWYSGYDQLNIAPSDVFTSAVFDWKQASVAVSINGLEQLQNSGPEQVIDLLEARIENAEVSMKNGIAEALYGDGTDAGGKAIGGLQLLVPDDPTTGTVGGINRATWTFWRSFKYSGVTDGGAAVSNSNIVKYMNKVYLGTSRGNDHVDIILADNDYYSLYWEALQAQQRFTSDDMAAAGFTSLKYQGADVVFDGGIGGAAPSAHMYFLNTNYVYLRPHKSRQYVPLGGNGGTRVSVDQDALVKLIGWAGNMTISGSQFQGALIA